MSETKLPTMGKQGPGRPSKAEMDEREALLEERERQLDERQERLEAELEANPAPIQSASEQTNRTKGENQKSIRRQMGQGKRLNADRYVELHPEKKLLWINEMNGDVQRWINAGAEPVPVETNDSRKFEGITDQHESKWVRSVGGDDGMGGHFWVYLLMIDPKTYDEVELAPLRERQQAIKDAMTRGKDQSDSESGLESYAPNLPTGGRGFQQITDEITGRS